MKKLIVLLSLITLNTLIVQAQDKLYLKGERNPLDVKVLEIGPSEIKVEDRENDVVQVYDTYDINKIIYANGRVQKFENLNEQNIDRYREMNFNAFSVDMTGAFFNMLRISYDRIIKPGLSYELAASYIGLSPGRDIAFYGTQDPNTYRWSNTLAQQTSGFRIEGGMKAIRLPNFVSGRIRYRHLLQGSYLKPWAAFEYVSQNYVDSLYYKPNSTYLECDYQKLSYPSMNLGLDFGRSWVASNRVLVDLYFGVGYSFSGFKKVNTRPTQDDYIGPGYIADSYDDTRGYGYLRTQPNRTASFILRFGVKAGYVFNWKKDNDKVIR